MTATDPMEPRVLLHYDILALDAATRRRIDRFLYGDRQVKHVDGRRKIYRYPGLLERKGGRHYGQSVIILPRDAADDAFYFIRGMKVSCERVDILAPAWI